MTFSFLLAEENLKKKWKRPLSFCFFFMVLFAGSNAPDLVQEMVSASWCGVLASLSLLLEARYLLRVIVVVYDKIIFSSLFLFNKNCLTFTDEENQYP